MDPGQTLWMRQDRDVAGDHKVEEKMLHPYRRDVMGRLDENIARVSQREKASGPEPSNKIGRHVHICTGHKTKGNALSLQGLLQGERCVPDLWAGVMVEPGQNVRRTRDNGDPVGDVQLRHLHRDAQIACTIIDAGKNMAVEINHWGMLRVWQDHGMGSSADCGKFATQTPKCPSGRAPLLSWL